MELEDFINNPKFVLWVSHPDPELNAFWSGYLAEKPEEEPAMEQAKNIVLAMRFKSENLPADEQKLLWNNIKNSIQQQKRPVLRLSVWLRAAAALFLLGILSAGILWYTQQQRQEFSTAFGERRNLTLPDGSEVTLNANSLISYAKNWKGDKPREVWIEGEAFFKIKHLHKSGIIKPAERFVVHAKKLNVEVLGTSFNVSNRRNLVRVALLTGKVGLDIEGLENDQLRLIPGELAEYKAGTNALFKSRVAIHNYTDWRNGQLHFNNTPLAEVLVMIEDIYGYKTRLTDPSIAQRRLSGNFSSNTEEVLFKAIATSLGVSIQQNKSVRQLTIK